MNRRFETKIFKQFNRVLECIKRALFFFTVTKALPLLRCFKTTNKKTQQRQLLGTARICKVSDRTVNRLRQSICDNDADTKLNKERKAQRGGKTYTLNTTNIGKKASTPKDTNRVTVKPDHPLFSGQSGIITQHPNPDAAIIKLDAGSEELIYLKDLIVEQPEDKELPELAHHLKLTEGGLVEICVSNNSRINKRLGRIASVRDNTIEVWVRDVERMMMHLYTLKHQQVEIVLMSTEPQLVEVSERIAKLRKCNLDPFEVEILLLLERPVVFTPTELEYLTTMEQRHGI